MSSNPNVSLLWLNTKTQLPFSYCKIELFVDIEESFRLKLIAELLSSCSIVGHFINLWEQQRERERVNVRYREWICYFIYSINILKHWCWLSFFFCLFDIIWFHLMRTFMDILEVVVGSSYENRFEICNTIYLKVIYVCNYRVLYLFFSLLE